MPLKSGSRVCAKAAAVMNSAATTRVVFMALFPRFVVAEPELDAVAVGEGHLPHESEVGSVLRVIPENRDRLSLPEVCARDAGPAGGAGTEARKRPWRHLAARVFHVEVDIHVRVDPLDFRHRALQRHRLVDVELRRERMMRRERCARERERSDRAKKNSFHGGNTPVHVSNSSPNNLT